MCHPLQDFEGLLDASLKKMCTPAGVADGKVSPPSRPLSISWPAPLPTNLPVSPYPCTEGSLPNGRSRWEQPGFKPRIPRTEPSVGSRSARNLWEWAHFRGPCWPCTCPVAWIENWPLTKHQSWHFFKKLIHGKHAVLRAVTDNVGAACRSIGNPRPSFHRDDGSRGSSREFEEPNLPWAQDPSPTTVKFGEDRVKGRVRRGSMDPGLDHFWWKLPRCCKTNVARTTTRMTLPERRPVFVGN